MKMRKNYYIQGMLKGMDLKPQPIYVIMVIAIQVLKSIVHYAN